jgi:hypothetical protein
MSFRSMAWHHINAALIGKLALSWLTFRFTKRKAFCEPESRPIFGAFLESYMVSRAGSVGAVESTIPRLNWPFVSGIVATGAALIGTTGVGYPVDPHRDY